MDIAEIWGWPAGFGAKGIDAALYSGGPLVDQPPLHPDGNVNYYLTDHHNPLLGLQITVDFDENFVPQANGFSFQLQAFSPSRSSIGVQQYIISADPGNPITTGWADIWDQNGKEILKTPPKTLTTLAGPPPIKIPQKYQFLFALTYDTTDPTLVTGATFTVKNNPTGNVPGGVVIPPSPGSIGLPKADFAPVSAITFNIGAGVPDATAKIAPGSVGTITYTATNPLTVSTFPPPGLALSFKSKENSNILFGPLPATPHTSVTQGWRADPGV
jgi:hypothetical protein